MWSSSSYSTASFSALSWLLDQIVIEVKRALDDGGHKPHRKSRRATPHWLPVLPVDEDETLLFLGLL